MNRTLDFAAAPENFNPWVAKSINLFAQGDYLDQLLTIYPFAVSAPRRLSADVKRKFRTAFAERDIVELMRLLRGQTRFPYEDPVWHSLRNARDAAEQNPRQMERIANTLFQMSAEEIFARLEAAPSANTQIGPMFGAWLQQRYPRLPADQFRKHTQGIVLFEGSEEIQHAFVRDALGQDLDKRPDVLAKVNREYVIGEAKWVGSPGGNQYKQIREVLHFCGETRGNVRRVGIIDGFPWALYNNSGGTINNKETVKVQESPYPIMSALLLPEYLENMLAGQTISK